MQEAEDLLSFEENIKVDEEARVYLKDIARWGKFVSVTSLVLLFIFAILLYISKNNGAYFFRIRFSSSGGLMLIVCSVVECILLFRFSRISEYALSNDDVVDFNRGLKSLKIYFIIDGILGILLSFFAAISLM